MRGLSPRAQRLITEFAQNEGRKSGCEQLLPEHVLLALVKSADGLGYILLQALHINVLTYRLSLEQSIMVRTPMENTSDLPPSRRMRTLLDIATVEARSARNDYVGTEHIVLAAIREEQSITFRYFEKASVTLDEARRAVKEIQSRMQSSAFVPAGGSALAGAAAGAQGTNRRQNGSQRTFLSEYSRNITELAQNDRLDPVVGRDKEIMRVIQILSRRTKNNPMLIGEPGVGKTAIVEGLAGRIARGEVPANLRKKRVLALDLTALVAGTKYRGEFEERMKRMMNEISESKDIILFIDEMHTIIGAGGPEGAMDASNILKPALSRGEIQIIGATTIKEYRRYVEKDAALERRFQLIKVEEPSDVDTTAILEGIKKKYEEFHGVIYDEGVIPAIVKFSHRYIPERCLPDKAIDILDEAGAAKKIQGGSQPVELAELEKSIEDLTAEKKQLVLEQDYEKAALVRDKVIDLKKKLEEYRAYWDNPAESDRRRVTEFDICTIISGMTGIPVAQLDESESHKLLRMESELHKDVVGQHDAVKVISSAIRRCRTGVSSNRRPMGSFIFLGPTGVGKTQLAKMLAKFLFGSEDALIRIDMSDYMEKHNASRLTGAPPGYIGYEDGGILTEKVRRHPYSVVLLDEIEKAHPDVFNLLLQLLEEGELSDNLGHTVNFRNTVIIMTSNAGAREITRDGRAGFTPDNGGVLSYREIQADAMNELKKLMRPELLNRIDDIVVFNALTRDEVSQILDIQIRELEGRLSERKLSLKLSKSAHEYLVEHGYDPAMGARPMRRLIQNDIEDPLAMQILENGASGQTVLVDSDGEKLTVRLKKQRRISAPLSVQESLVKVR